MDEELAQIYYYICLSASATGSGRRAGEPAASDIAVYPATQATYMSYGAHTEAL